MLTLRPTFTASAAPLAMAPRVIIIHVDHSRRTLLSYLVVVGVAINFVYDGHSRSALDAISRHFAKKIDNLPVRSLTFSLCSDLYLIDILGGAPRVDRR